MPRNPPAPMTEESELETIMAYLFAELPFAVRHRWGGDPVEFLEGIRVAISWQDTEVSP